MLVCPRPHSHAHSVSLLRTFPSSPCPLKKNTTALSQMLTGTCVDKLEVFYHPRQGDRKWLLTFWTHLLLSAATQQQCSPLSSFIFSQKYLNFSSLVCSAVWRTFGGPQTGRTSPFVSQTHVLDIIHTL